MSNVLAPSVCNNSAPCDVAKAAGFYNATTSTTEFDIGQTGDIRNAQFAGTVGAIQTLSGSANWMFDTVSILFTNGVAGISYTAVLPDYDLLVISSAYETLPDGTTYPVQIGKLGLGAPEFNQSWNFFPPNPRWNGTQLSSAIYSAGRTSSISYGMHVGSVALGIPGSLSMGGYDSSRVLGPVSSQAYIIDHLPIDLLDIGIGVAEGGSPFDFDSKEGLLHVGNSTMGVALSVQVEAPIPYIYLPQSTCDAITKNLPVTYQPKLGLYFWNTNDPKYNAIVSSPAFLSFTFRANSSITQNFTINVPFALLNLTLTAPITTSPTAYLPLRPIITPAGSYALGRAFMQAAFVGVNFQTALPGNGNGAWFLAQAPGPNTPSQNPTTNIAIGDTIITGSSNSWVESWKGAWTVIANGSTPSTPSRPSTNGTAGASGPSDTTLPDASHSGVSTGAIAGIAIGAVAVLAICVAGAVLFYRRRRNANANAIEGAGGAATYGNSAEMNGIDPSEKYRGSGYGPRELGTGVVPSRPVEMAG